ncbi:hypothetical protein K8P03_02305 [Anaerococcus murdochii]|uniref:M protein repeat protein n=2 Tax=Anaerococcus TaxID=165779 RepID=A0ABS7SX56_9FIRM|nr:hypothetical protein [Anaerococcus murdochii]MBZ2386132.1 hypothetical protein [Anaerococcus murdochii]
MKKKIIITSLMMASVLPFMGKIETARADEGKNLNEKAKSELDQAKENLKSAQDKKTNLEKDLDQAKKDAAKNQEEKEALEKKLGKIEENIKNNEEILAKEQQKNELDKKIEELKQREKEVNAELEAATKTYQNAEKVYEAEKANPSPSPDFASKDRVDDLKNEYDLAENYHGQIQKKEDNLKEDLSKIEGDLYKAYGQKNGIEEFIKEFESQNPDKKDTPAYKAFREKALAKSKIIDENYNRLEKEVKDKNEKIIENKKELASSEQKRDDRYNAYKKEELALGYETDYKNAIIKDKNLEGIQNSKVNEVAEASKTLQDSIREKEEAENAYQEYLENEAMKRKEFHKSKSISEWLNKNLADDRNDFAKDNKTYLKNLANIHDQRAKGIIEELTKFSQHKKDLEKAVDYKKHQLYSAKANYETKTNSLEAITEFRKFLENKKNGRANSQILESLKEKYYTAKAELDKKLKEIDDITKEQQKFIDERDRLGVGSEDVQKAKEKIAENNAEIDRLKNDIKALEKSEELKKVKSLEEQIKTLDQQIKDLQKQIKNLENPRKQDNPTRPDHRTEGSSDNNIADDYGIDLSSLSLEKMDKKIRLKNSYLRLKASVNRAKEVVTLAENYAKTGKMDANKRAKLIKLIEKLKVNIGLVEKHLVKMEASL